MSEFYAREAFLEAQHFEMLCAFGIYSCMRALL